MFGSEGVMGRFVDGSGDRGFFVTEGGRCRRVVETDTWSYDGSPS